MAEPQDIGEAIAELKLPVEDLLLDPPFCDFLYDGDSIGRGTFARENGNIRFNADPQQLNWHPVFHANIRTFQMLLELHLNSKLVHLEFRPTTFRKFDVIRKDGSILMTVEARYQEFKWLLFFP